MYLGAYQSQFNGIRLIEGIDEWAVANEIAQVFSSESCIAIRADWQTFSALEKRKFAKLGHWWRTDHHFAGAGRCKTPHKRVLEIWTKNMVQTSMADELWYTAATPVGFKYGSYFQLANCCGAKIVTLQGQLAAPVIHNENYPSRWNTIKSIMEREDRAHICVEKRGENYKTALLIQGFQPIITTDAHRVWFKPSFDSITNKSRRFVKTPVVRDKLGYVRGTK